VLVPRLFATLRTYTWAQFVADLTAGLIDEALEAARAHLVLPPEEPAAAPVPA
jgi:hypothetical protein